MPNLIEVQKDSYQSVSYTHLMRQSSFISRPVVMDVMQSSRSVAQLYCRTEQVRL